MTFLRWTTTALMAAVLCCANVSAMAQLRGAQPVQPPPPPAQSGGPDTWTAKRQKELQKKANFERQEDIKKDTEKLLELATELKQAVEKSNENTLSMDVIKKAEQIEKLAKIVKDKMKGS